MTIGSTGPSEMSLARALARASLAVDLGSFDVDVIAKAKICLLDFLLSCAFEARHHAWSRQAIGIARGIENGATIIGTNRLSTPGDAAFANATLGHGLVREDMHCRQHLPPRRGALADPARIVGTNAARRRDIACGGDHRL